MNAKTKKRTTNDKRIKGKRIHLPFAVFNRPRLHKIEAASRGKAFTIFPFDLFSIASSIDS